MRADAARAQWRQSFADVVSRSAEVAGSLSERQLAWVPPDGGWSASQVLTHLATTNEEYVKEIRTALSRSARAAADAEWKPSLFGRMLDYALRSPRKSRAPAAFKPRPRAGENSLQRFNASVRALESELDRSDGVDLSLTRVRSPAWRTARMNLGDAFHLQVLHAERHLQQIRRITEHTEFPG